MLEYLNNTDNDQVLNEDIPDVKTSNGNDLPTQEPFVPGMMDIMSLFPTDYASMLDDMMQDFVPDDDMNFLSLSSGSPVPFLTDAGYSLLESKSASMAMDLYTIHCTLASTDATYNDTFDPQQAESVLCVDNLRSYIATFFRLSHLHFPIVHYPTFGTMDTSKCLLLTVIMCGAYRSAPMPDTVAILGYLRLAEEYVFREIEFAMGTSPPGPPTPENLQILQAGIMNLYLLFLTNDRGSRRRGQVQRLPRLVAAVRHFGLNKMRRTPGVEWYKFIYEETCLRYVCLPSCDRLANVLQCRIVDSHRRFSPCFHVQLSPRGKHAGDDLQPALSSQAVGCSGHGCFHRAPRGPCSYKWTSVAATDSVDPKLHCLSFR